MININDRTQLYIYNVKQLNIQMLSNMFLPHDAGQGGRKWCWGLQSIKPRIVHLSVLLQVAKPKLQEEILCTAKWEKNRLPKKCKVSVLMSSAHNMYQHGICRKEDHRKSILTFVGLKNYAQSRTANGASTGPNSRIFIGPYLSCGGPWDHNN